MRLNRRPRFQPLIRLSQRQRFHRRSRSTRGLRYRRLKRWNVRSIRRQIHSNRPPRSRPSKPWIRHRPPRSCRKRSPNSLNPLPSATGRAVLLPRRLRSGRLISPLFFCSPLIRIKIEPLLSYTVLLVASNTGHERENRDQLTGHMLSLIGIEEVSPVYSDNQATIPGIVHFVGELTVSWHKSACSCGALAEATNCFEAIPAKSFL